MKSSSRWFLSKDQEKAVVHEVSQLFLSSLKSGRDLDVNCPDFAQGFGSLQILKTLKLIDLDEREALLANCKKEAKRMFADE